jgi:hypothetical protein
VSCYEHFIFSFEIHPQNVLYISQNKHYQIHPLLDKLVFFIGIFNFKNTQFEQGLKRPFRHFGQVDFDMSIMIGWFFSLTKYGLFD